MDLLQLDMSNELSHTGLAKDVPSVAHEFDLDSLNADEPLDSKEKADASLLFVKIPSG